VVSYVFDDKVAAVRPIHRLLDANSNRAREAMRVMEDAARFLLDDPGLARELKSLRHDFASAMRLLGLGRPLEWHRDTPGDVGTRIGTRAESQRQDVHDVVVAAGKRLTEALRSLEEYGKIETPVAAGRVEALRYRAYELERKLLGALGSRRRRQWRLCVIITESLCAHRPWLDVARACLDAGADCLQLREKTLDDRELHRRACALVGLATDRAAARKAPPSVIINDRPDIASAACADGVHLGEQDMPPDRVRLWARRDFLIGVSTHSLAEARAAIRAGADYCGVGAIFPTTTKDRRPSGLRYLHQFISHHPHRPHLAIGGITPDNVSQVIEAGARGVAVSSIVCGAASPAAVVRRLLRKIPPLKDSPTSPRPRRP
jgi:thiamine-phosphate pyrophosphorylase